MKKKTLKIYQGFKMLFNEETAKWYGINRDSIKVVVGYKTPEFALRDLVKRFIRNV